MKWLFSLGLLGSLCAAEVAACNWMFVSHWWPQSQLKQQRKWICSKSSPFHICNLRRFDWHLWHFSWSEYSHLKLVWSLCAAKAAACRFMLVSHWCPQSQLKQQWKSIWSKASRFTFAISVSIESALGDISWSDYSHLNLIWSLCAAKAAVCNFILVSHWWPQSQLKQQRK